MFLSILIISFLPLFITSHHVSAAEAERNPKGKPAAKADFVLTVKDNLISLKAKDASLKEVLEEIARRMKIDVVAGIPDTKKITAEFENLSIEEALRRLSTNYSYAMDSTRGERKITKIIVVKEAEETALSTPTAKESAIKKEEKPVKTESKGREEVTRKESPSPKPFSYPGK
jgi:type II secretory pathway component GspD/PulD (secretin)